MSDKPSDESYGSVIDLKRERIKQHPLINELNDRMVLVSMLSDISTRAIVVEDLAAFLDECMYLIGKTTRVGGVFLWEYNGTDNTFSNISEWVQNGIPSHKDKLQAIPGDGVPGFMEALQNRRVMNFPDTREIGEPVFREITEMMGILSLLIIPLYIKNRLFGFLGFEEYTRHRQWDTEDINILKSITEILSRAIDNNQVEQELDDYRVNLESMIKQRTSALEEANRRLTREVHERKAIASKLVEHEADLTRKSERLAEVNTALRVLMHQLQEERRRCEENAYRKYVELVEPMMKKLRHSKLSSKQKTYLELIEKNIKHIYVADRCSLLPEFKTMTANEIQVADLIRHGKTSKVIAELMNISIRTVEVYRYNIRKKLGLNKTKSSLHDFLVSLDP